MLVVEVDGKRIQLTGLPRNVGEVLGRAIGSYLDQTGQPNHTEIVSHRVDGWSGRFRRYDVYAETDTENGRGRRHRYFDVTVYN
ncbi:hypothetical protein [Flindersiella endophytica]